MRKKLRRRIEIKRSYGVSFIAPSGVHERVFLQCVFLVYCMLPVSWNGSVTIYSRVIRPFFLRHEKDVDSAIDKAVDATRSALKEGR